MPSPVNARLVFNGWAQREQAKGVCYNDDTRKSPRRRANAPGLDTGEVTPMRDQTTKQVGITRDEARGLRILINGYFDDVAGDESADQELTDTLGEFLSKLDKAFS